MRTITICAIVVAISTFTMAVEDVYGWSKVRPHAEAVWAYGYQLSTELIDAEARTDTVGTVDDSDVPASKPAQE